MKPAEKFRQHHYRLMQQYRQIRDRLDDNSASLPELTDYFRKNVLPHARAEESVLYSMVDSLAESHLATASMRRDHDHICELVETLEGPQERERNDCKPTLHKLDEVFENHFEKEEDILLPFLESSLPEGEFNQLLKATHNLEEEEASTG